MKKLSFLITESGADYGNKSPPHDHMRFVMIYCGFAPGSKIEMHFLKTKSTPSFLSWVNKIQKVSV